MMWFRMAISPFIVWSASRTDARVRVSPDQVSPGTDPLSSLQAGIPSSMRKRLAGPVPAGVGGRGGRFAGSSESLGTPYTQLYRVSRNNFLANGCTGRTMRLVPCTWSHSCLLLRGVVGHHEADLGRPRGAGRAPGRGGPS